MNLEDLINQLPTKFKPCLLRERCKNAGIKYPSPFNLSEYGLRRSNQWLLKDSHLAETKGFTFGFN